MSSGALATDWGAGNFIALKFEPDDGDTAAGAETYRVGLNPSMGSGLVALDSDMDAVLKITSTSQKLVVETVGAGATWHQEYDLSGLTLNDS